MKKLLVVFITALCVVSSTDAEMSKLGGFGDSFKVELINCDGSVSRSWISSGKVLSESNSDGYYFNDNESNQLIQVTGTIIITKLN